MRLSLNAQIFCRCRWLEIQWDEDAKLQTCTMEVKQDGSLMIFGEEGDYIPLW